jgi:hypothetical protein
MLSRRCRTALSTRIPSHVYQSRGWFPPAWACSLGDRGVMRSIPFKRLARLGTGAILLLLVHGLTAPGSAWAGCNHLDASRTDPGRLPSIFDALLDDLAAPANGNPTRQPPRPCSGAFCSGQPATPAVPLGAVDWVVDSWACCASESGTLSRPCSFFAAGSSAPRPILRVSGIFHPPRLPAAF